MSKKTIIKGTLILTIAGIATKLLGFYNRIFLTRLIGVIELGTYQLIFPIYVLAFSFCAQGIATTITKQVSFFFGKEESDKAKKVFKYALTISVILSLFISIIIKKSAYFLSLYILKNTNCCERLNILQTAVPFVAAKACINSYFMGINKPEYQGLSHFIEQVIRISTAYVLSILWAAEKIDAKLAVVAVVCGEISATLLAIILYMLHIKSQSEINTHNKLQRKEKTLILKNLIKDSVPITSTGLILTLFSSFEAIILPTMLYNYYGDTNVAMELYGILTGIVIPFLLLPSTVTTSLSTMLLPAVSYAKARNNGNTINKTIKYSIEFCMFLGIVTCILYKFSGEWICSFAFKSQKAGIILKKLCIVCPFIYMSGNMSSILNGLDKAFYNLLFNIINICIRIAFTIILVPKYGLDAYLVGMFVSYFMLNIFMSLTIRKFSVIPTGSKNAIL